MHATYELQHKTEKTKITATPKNVTISRTEQGNRENIQKKKRENRTFSSRYDTRDLENELNRKLKVLSSQFSTDFRLRPLKTHLQEKIKASAITDFKEKTFETSNSYINFFRTN